MKKKIVSLERLHTVKMQEKFEATGAPACAFAKPESPPLFHPPVEIHANKVPQAYQWLRLPIPKVLSLVQGLDSCAKCLPVSCSNHSVICCCFPG